MMWYRWLQFKCIVKEIPVNFYVFLVVSKFAIIEFQILFYTVGFKRFMPAHLSRMRHVVCHVDYIEVPWYLQHHHLKPFILQRWHTLLVYMAAEAYNTTTIFLPSVSSSSCLQSWRINQERFSQLLFNIFRCLLLFYSRF